MHVCICMHTHPLPCLCVFVCSGKSGVWILSSCLSDRKVSSVKQRGRSISQRYASFLKLCRFPQTEAHIRPHPLILYALTQTVFAGCHPRETDTHFTCQAKPPSSLLSRQFANFRQVFSC